MNEWMNKWINEWMNEWMNKWMNGVSDHLCAYKYRLNWTRRTSWGWWDDWDDTVLQTKDSKFEHWRSGAEHATSRSQMLSTIPKSLYEWNERRRNISFLWNLNVRAGYKLFKQAASTTAPRPSPEGQVTIRRRRAPAVNSTLTLTALKYFCINHGDQMIS